MRVARAATIITTGIVAGQLAIASAEAEKRVALVICNDAYQKGALSQPNATPTK
jgi:hypothetical protein